MTNNMRTTLPNSSQINNKAKDTQVEAATILSILLLKRGRISKPWRGKWAELAQT